MNDLLVIAFPSEQKAEEVRQKLFELQKEYLIELGDAVIAVKQPNDQVKLNQLFSTTAVGAASGAFAQAAMHSSSTRWNSLFDSPFLRVIVVPSMRAGWPGS